MILSSKIMMSYLACLINPSFAISALLKFKKRLDLNPILSKFMLIMSVATNVATGEFL